MTEEIKRFGLGTAPGGLRAIYGKTVEGPRIWIVDTADINYVGTTQLIDLLNAGLAAPDMLAALEAVEAADGKPGWQERVAVRHAIAKAKGERE